MNLFLLIQNQYENLIKGEKGTKFKDRIKSLSGFVLKLIPKVLIFIGGFLIAIRLFFPPFFYSQDGRKKYVSYYTWWSDLKDRPGFDDEYDFLLSYDHSLAILHSLAIAMIVGVLYFLLTARFKKKSS